MGELEDLLANETHRQARKKRPTPPSGWEPGIDTEKGVVVARGTADGPGEWDHIIRQFALDPEQWQVDSDTVHVRAWDGPSGDRLYYYKADLRPLTARPDADVEALCKRIGGHRKPKRQPPSGDHAMLVCLSDWQIGKRDGDGPDGTIDRVLEAIDKVEDRVRTLRSQGVELGALYVAGLGDMVEGCGDHYPMQVWQTVLDRRSQVKVVRRLLVKALTRWSKLFGRVVVVCVPGNHGENRKGGKAYTTFGDNDDVAVFEQVRDVFAANPDVYGHIAFVIPDEELTVTLDICGTYVAFAHGHQARGGGSPEQKLLRWWKGKQHGRHHVGDADLLVTGHYHHLQLKEDGPRTWMQCPTLDGGSQWWQERGGVPSKAGTLTVVVGPDGWTRLEVLP